MAQAVSVSWLADAFELDRRTVSKKLKEGGVEPVGTNGPAKLFNVGDAAPFLCKPVYDQLEEGFDPTLLPPMERNQYFASEKNRIAAMRDEDKMKLDRGLLLEYDNVEFGVAALLKSLREGLLLLPDLIEAEAGLNLKQRRVVDEQTDLVLANTSANVRKIFSGVDDEQLPED